MIGTKRKQSWYASCTICGLYNLGKWLMLTCILISLSYMLVVYYQQSLQTSHFLQHKANSFKETDLYDDTIAEQYLKMLQTTKLKSNEIPQLVKQFEIYRAISAMLQPQIINQIGVESPILSSHSSSLPPNVLHNFHQIKQTFENQFFPYFKQSHLRFIYPHSYQQNTQGIVIPINNKYFAIAFSTLQMIRNHNCELPIEIIFMGENDLSIDRQIYLQKQISFLRLIDLTDYLNLNHPSLLLQGWFIKPFALLLSSFEEILLIDADIVFLQHPELLFHSKVYETTGTLFFYDRKVIRSRKSIVKYQFLLQKIFQISSITTSTLNYTTDHTILSSYDKHRLYQGHNLSSSRMFFGESEYDMDSGIVLWHKGKHWYSLLLLLLLNTLPYRKYIQQVSMGDKECYWIACALLYESYGYVDEHVGTIGNPTYPYSTIQMMKKSTMRKKEKNRQSLDKVDSTRNYTILCGSLAHNDERLQYNISFLYHLQQRDQQQRNHSLRLFPLQINPAILSMIPSHISSITTSPHITQYTKPLGFQEAQIFWFQDSLLLYKRQFRNYTMINHTHVNFHDLWGIDDTLPVYFNTKQCSMGGKNQPLSTTAVTWLQYHQQQFKPDTFSIFPDATKEFQRPK
jgi:hypothetical protein